jgi:hypothetical protein
MRTKTSMTQRIRALINKGYNNKDIIAKLKCKPQAVYNIRYQMNKERGLGSIGTLPKPTDGIGAPPKKRTRKVKAGTGIVSEPWTPPPVLPVPEPYNVTTLNHQSVREQFGTPGTWKELPITMVEPKPTLWQRVKGWFHG